MRGPTGGRNVSGIKRGWHPNRHKTPLPASGATAALPLMVGFPAHLAPTALPLVAPPARQTAAAADDTAIAPRPRMLRVPRLAAPPTPAAGPLMTNYASHFHCISDWGKAALPVEVHPPPPWQPTFPSLPCTTGKFLECDRFSEGSAAKLQTITPVTVPSASAATIPAAASTGRPPARSTAFRRCCAVTNSCSCRSPTGWAGNCTRSATRFSCTSTTTAPTRCCRCWRMSIPSDEF